MKTENRFRLDGKTILVTGGTRGIGRAISLAFGEAGADVIAGFVRNQKEADSLEALAGGNNVSIKSLRADLTRASGLEAIEKHLDELGRPLSGLVHSAATGVHKGVQEFTPRDIRWVFALNIEAFIGLVGQILPRMEDGGSIVALSSKGATHAVPAYGLVGASKGALEAFSRQMASELASRRIRVNILCPGAVRTEAWEALPDNEARLDANIARTPIGRLVTAEEVADAAQFLCSDAASGVVGHKLVVDGGAAIPE